MGLMDIRRRILADAPQLATATGAVASFSTDMAVPLKQCQFGIEPVQSGTGDPSPSNVRPISGWTGAKVTRCGLNQYPYETIAAYSYEWYSGSKKLEDAVYPFFVKGGVNYVLAYTNSNSDAKLLLRVWRRDGTILSDEANVLNAKMVGGTYAYGWSTSPQYYVYPSISNANAVLIRPTEDLWIDARTQSDKGASSNAELRTGAGTYTPYAGTTYPVQFPAQGKNLFDPEIYGTLYDIASDGSFTIIGHDGTAWTNKPIVPVKAGTYTITYYSNGGGHARIKTSLDDYTDEITITSSYTITFSQDGGIRFKLGMNAPEYPISVKIQIEKGSTSTTYEPYTNTVYGGTVDVVTGVLTVTHAFETITKDGAWYSFTTGTANSSAVIQLSEWQNVKYVDGSSSYNGAISSTGVELQNYWVNARENESCANMGFAYSSGGQLRVHMTDIASITDLASFKAAFPDTQICYPLATPKTYQLTPQQITALKGQNNVWCDTGNTTVQYWKH